jgi:hypothetical protein
LRRATIAATSASSASAARSTAATAAAPSLSAAETAARNWASCCVDQTAARISGNGEEDERLVVEPVSAAQGLLGRAASRPRFESL